MKKKRKARRNRIEKILGALFSYLLAIFSTVIFALYCSGRVGWFLLMVVLGAPLLSFVWTFIAYNFVTAGLYTQNRLVEKGKWEEFRLYLRNRGFLPVPEISVYLKNDGRVAIERKIISLSFVMRGEIVEDSKFFTMFAGLSEVEIEKVVVSDFFGVLNLKLKKDVLESIAVAKDATEGFDEDSVSLSRKLEIGILPTLKELEHEDEWLLSARSAAFDGEEPEDTINDSSATFGGFPGYDHRDYVPGDPIKRINYKLSARVGRLQVRLDETQAVAGISMYLSDALRTDMSEGEPYIKNCSQCLDEFIAIARHLYILDFAVTVYLPNDYGFELTNDSSIEELREKLAFQKFEPADFVDESTLKSASGSLIALMPYSVNPVIEMLKKYSYLEGNSVSVYVSSIEKGRRL